MAIEPGTILLVHFPFSDHTTGKLRPTLVVSQKPYNKGEDFIAVPISSQLSAEGYSILATEPYFKETGLRKDSTVRWTKVMTLSKRVVNKQLGSIPDEVLKEIQDHIRDIFT